MTDNWDAKNNRPGQDGIPDTVPQTLQLDQWNKAHAAQGAQAPTNQPTQTGQAPTGQAPAAAPTSSTAGLPQNIVDTLGIDGVAAGAVIHLGYGDTAATYGGTKYASLDNDKMKADVLAAAQKQNKHFDIATDPDQTLGRAAAIAQNLGATVEQVLKAMAAGQFAPASLSGGSAGGPFKQVDRRIQLTDEGTAHRLLNQTLSNFLGREASDEDVAAFKSALNAQERKNAQVVTTSGVRSANGSSSSQTSVSGGGFDSADFAERYAKAQKGSAEHQAATTYMDALINGIKDPMRLV